MAKDSCNKKKKFDLEKVQILIITMATAVGKMCGYLRGGGEDSIVFPMQYGYPANAVQPVL